MISPATSRISFGAIENRIANAVAPWSVAEASASSSWRRSSSSVENTTPWTCVEQRLGDALGIVLDHVVRPGGGEEGQAVGPGLGRHQQGRQRGLAAVEAGQVQRRHLRRQLCPALPPRPVAVLVGRLRKTPVRRGCSEPASTSSLTCLVSAGRFRLSLMLIPSWSNIWAKSSVTPSSSSTSSPSSFWPAGRATGRRRPTCAGA
jgi:hypothetical protein